MCKILFLVFYSFRMRLVLILLYKIDDKYIKESCLKMDACFSSTAKCVSMYACVMNIFETSNVYFIFTNLYLVRKQHSSSSFYLKTKVIVIILMILTQSNALFSKKYIYLLVILNIQIGSLRLSAVNILDFTTCQSQDKTCDI